MLDKRDGFSLFEGILYCFLVALMSVYLMPFFITVSAHVTAHTTAAQNLASMHAAFDLLQADISHARSDELLWDTHAAQTLIFTKDQQAIGWYLSKKALYRSVGIYDFAKKEWHKKSSALVCAIDQFSYELLIHAGSCQYAKVTLGGQNYQIENQTILIREGRA